MVIWVGFEILVLVLVFKIVNIWGNGVLFIIYKIGSNVRQGVGYVFCNGQVIQEVNIVIRVGKEGVCLFFVDVVDIGIRFQEVGIQFFLLFEQLVDFDDVVFKLNLKELWYIVFVYI